MCNINEISAEAFACNTFYTQAGCIPPCMPLPHCCNPTDAVHQRWGTSPTPPLQHAITRQELLPGIPQFAFWPAPHPHATTPRHAVLQLAVLCSHSQPRCAAARCVVLEMRAELPHMVHLISSLAVGVRYQLHRLQSPSARCTSTSAHLPRGTVMPCTWLHLTPLHLVLVMLAVRMAQHAVRFRCACCCGPC